MSVMIKGRRDSVAPALKPCTSRAARCESNDVPDFAAQRELARSIREASKNTGRLRKIDQPSLCWLLCLAGTYLPKTKAIGNKAKLPKPVNSEGHVRSLATLSGATPSTLERNIDVWLAISPRKIGC